MLAEVATFVAVVEEGGMTPAGRKLGVPKSTVSRQIARLEESLDVRLLERTSRQMRLTDAGRSFYGRVSGPVQEIRAASQQAEEEDAEPRGQVRITVPQDFASTLLPEILAEFRERYPEVAVRVDASNRKVDLLSEGFDLAVRAGRLEDSSLIARKVSADALWMVAATELEPPASVDQLEGIGAVVFHDQEEWRFAGPDGEVRVRVRTVVSGDDFQFVSRCVALGLGVGYMPGYIARQLVDSGRCRRWFPDYELPSGGVYVVTPSRMMAARVRVLRDHLIECLDRVF